MAFLKEILRPKTWHLPRKATRRMVQLWKLINFLAIEDKELKEGRSKTSTPDQSTPGHLLPEHKYLAQEAHARAACD